MTFKSWFLGSRKVPEIAASPPPEPPYIPPETVANIDYLLREDAHNWKENGAYLIAHKDSSICAGEFGEEVFVYMHGNTMKFSGKDAEYLIVALEASEKARKDKADKLTSAHIHLAVTHAKAIKAGVQI